MRFAAQHPSTTFKWKQGGISRDTGHSGDGWRAQRPGRLRAALNGCCSADALQTVLKAAAEAALLTVYRIVRIFHFSDTRPKVLHPVPKSLQVGWRMAQRGKTTALFWLFPLTRKHSKYYKRKMQKLNSATSGKKTQRTHLGKCRGNEERFDTLSLA